MTLSVAVIRAAVASGCTADQLAAIVIADITGESAGIVTMAAPDDARSNLEGDIPVTIEPEGDISPRAMQPINNAVAIARKAITLAPGLSRSTWRVAGAIIDHFNRRTGQCDPSMGGIATKLSLCRRTVIRAVGQLTAAGLFVRIRHGGYSHRNAYRPVWRQFALIVDQWDARMADPSAPVVAAVSPLAERRQASHPQGARGVTQTYVKNPDRLNPVCGTSGRPAKRPDPAQPQMLLPINSKPAGPGLEAAKDRVSNAVTAHLVAVSRLHFATVYPTIPGDVWEAARCAEYRQRGSGLGVVVRHLRGPPMAKTG